MAEKSKLTPVMQQYVDMKAENPDALLMFRLGDFYESFFEDAKVISSTLGLVLTARGTDGDGESIPMCGIPWHAADNYFGRLVRSGYKVALVEQMETPAQAKARGHKYIERKVVRVLTPGTLTDENLLTPKNSNFLVAVSPMAGGKKYDIAGCDISTGEFFVGQTRDLIDDMVRINPAEVIFPFSSAEEKNIMTLRGLFKSTPVYEKLYHRTDIDSVVARVFGGAIDSRNITTDLDSAICLLAGYLFNTQRDATITFRAPYTYKSGRQLLIDSATWKSLEIDAPINDGGACLIDVLDETQTASGARKLRAYLRNLSGELSEIQRRQMHVSHFLLNPDIRTTLSHVLSGVPDLGRSLSRLLSGRGTPRDMRHISEFLNMLPRAQILSGRLDGDFAPRFANINMHTDFANTLNNALADELPTFFRDGGVIRDGFDVALDNMRGLSHGAKETIAALQSEYIAQTGINTLKIKYNNILGYFIEVPSARAEIMTAPESGFIHRQTMAGNMRFTTPRLIDLDNDVRSAAEKASGIEDAIVNDFINQIRSISDDLLATADLLADADVWISLATVADKYSWVCPKITNDCAFDIVGGRHPVIESVLRTRGDNFVKNDCNLNTHSIALLTGPNMAGKSTFMRQQALIVLLAQIGSFVPAEYARIGIIDKIFTRVGAVDDLSLGQSTFMVEMNETAYILNSATEKSLILLDEIGRGTSTYDGVAIAWSVAEYISQKIKARTIFATHYHELNVMPKSYPSIKNYRITISENDGEIVFLRKVVEGSASKSYGIQVAKMAGLPKSVVDCAEKLMVKMQKDFSKDLSKGKASKIPEVDVPQLSLLFNQNE